MILASQVYNQQTWLQRIIQGKCSDRFCKQVFYFFTGLIILIFGIYVAALSLDNKTFPLAMTIIATATVFHIVMSVVKVVVCREPEEFMAPQLEGPRRYRIEHIKI